MSLPVSVQSESRTRGHMGWEQSPTILCFTFTETLPSNQVQFIVLCDVKMAVQPIRCQLTVNYKDQSALSCQSMSRPIEKRVTSCHGDLTSAGRGLCGTGRLAAGYLETHTGHQHVCTCTSGSSGRTNQIRAPMCVCVCVRTCM